MRSRIGRLLRATRPWAADAALTAVLTSVVTVWLYHSSPTGIPLTYSGDGLGQLAVVKGIVETGWYTHNSSLGAPNGFVAHDFPLSGDNLHYVVMKMMAWFSHDPVRILNVYFLGSFVLVSISAVVVLRILGLRRWLAHPLALLFSFLPAHLMRGTAHIGLATYYSVPLACWLLWSVMGDGLPLVGSSQGRRTRLDRSARSWGVLAACVVLGTASVYYGMFTVVLLSVAGLAASAARRSWRPLASAAACVVLIGLVVGVNGLPSALYEASHGHNPMAVFREARQLDGLSLRPVQMVSPVPGHRFGPLSTLARRIDEASPGGEGTQHLGLVAGAGFVLALGALMVRSLRSGDRPHVIDPRGGLLIVAMLVVGSTGGLALIPAVEGVDQVRAWGRLSVFVGFLALVAVGQGLQRVVTSWRMPALAALSLGLVVVGLWDQTPRSIVLDSRVNRAAFFEDEQFVRSAEALLPAGSMVFQLPHASYPEEPPLDGLQISDMLRPYLHSHTLRWSFGGMRGRETEWMESTVTEPLPQMLDALAAIDYRAVYVDSTGFADGGTSMLAGLTNELGQPIVRSTSGRFVLFDLRPRRAELLAGRGADAVTVLAHTELTRPYLWLDSGFEFPIRTDAGRLFSARAKARSTIVRPDGGPEDVTLSFHAELLVNGPATLNVVAGGSAVIGLPLDSGGRDVTLSVHLPGEHTTINWSVDGPSVGAAGSASVVRLSHVTIVEK